MAHIKYRTGTKHLVEFLPGIGVRVDGVVVDATVTAGVAKNWTVPMGVTEIILDACAGGGGGGGGFSGGSPGGGGGASGRAVKTNPIVVTPGSTLAITCGAAGSAGALSGAGGTGGDTIIDGVLDSADSGTANRLRLVGGIGGGAPTSTVGGTGGSNATAGTTGAGAGGVSSGIPNVGYGTSQSILGCGGNGGGDVNGTTPTTGGGFATGPRGDSSQFRSAAATGGSAPVKCGGGAGAFGLYSRGAAGGSNAAGGTADGYGGGGGGGAGNNTGGAGSVGMVRFTYIL